MFVQKAILTFEDKVQDLFIRRNDNEMSFDTFYNSLNIYLIKKYINGTKVRVKLDFDGDASIKFIWATKEGKMTILENDHLEKEYELNLSKVGEEGIIYPVFKGNFILKSFEYEVDSSEREVRVSFLITTYNRQEFLIPNLKKLNSISDKIHKVIIVDNARNLELDRKEFPEDKFILIPNDNLGGSGGFTRGMIEAKKENSTHMFIMDDDITLIPEVVEKAISLISSLSLEHMNDWLGFSMFPNENPLVQYELGTNWNGIKMVINNHLLDLSKEDNLYKNQINTKYNYSAWWSLIMPIDVLDKYGYPLPFFIKFDDIEYGLRRKDEEIILTNGFGVWHEDFDKKYNPYLEYYLFRNALVTNLLHVGKPLFFSLVRFLGKNVKLYFKGRFSGMKLMNQAINDFLKGPNFFFDLDIEKKNTEVREIAKTKINIFKGIFIYPFVSCFYFFKLLFSFNKVKAVYKKEYPNLTNMEYWSKIFKL